MGRRGEDSHVQCFGLLVPVLAHGDLKRAAPRIIYRTEPRHGRRRRRRLIELWPPSRDQGKKDVGVPQNDFIYRLYRKLIGSLGRLTSRVLNNHYYMYSPGAQSSGKARFDFDYNARLHGLRWEGGGPLSLAHPTSFKTPSLTPTHRLAPLPIFASRLLRTAASIASMSSS